MKREIRVFFTALMFYTRIPCPSWTDHDPEYMKESARYFSLIGWIVGAIGALAFWLSNQVFSVEISLVISIAATIRTTGGFHEDGLADVCDGFGGGWNKDKIILIMKDSTLGTFGVLGLIIVVLLKFLALNSFTPTNIPFVILAGHVLSRLTAARMLARGNYVENNNAAKAGSAAQKLSTASLITNMFFGLSVIFLFQNWFICLTLLPLLITEGFLYRFYKKWIGGYNGDCAGAVQQITEVLFYLSLIALWKYI